MSKPIRNILNGAICFGLTMIIAILGYMLAGWNFIDAAYMVVITVFGVGFGEVRPITSPWLRLFTMLVIVAGSTSVVYMVGGFVQLFTEGEIKQALEKRRMTQAIAALDHHIIVCGFGRMGQILVRQLSESRQPFVIVDLLPEKIALAEEQGHLAYLGNATDESVLSAVGIQKAKALATVLANDAANVFMTLTARELNPEITILARGEFPSTEKKLRLAGANYVVLPATIGALRMAHLITHPATLDFLDRNDGGNTLNELLGQVGLRMDELGINADSPLVGQTVHDIELVRRSSFIVVAIRRNDGQTVTEPSPDLKLEAGDTLIVMGRKDDLPRFVRTYNLKRELRYRGSNLT